MSKQFWARQYMDSQSKWWMYFCYAVHTKQGWVKITPTIGAPKTVKKRMGTVAQYAPKYQFTKTTQSGNFWT